MKILVGIATGSHMTVLMLYFDGYVQTVMKYFLLMEIDVKYETCDILVHSFVYHILMYR